MATEWAILPAGAADLQDLLDSGLARVRAADGRLEADLPTGQAVIFSRLYWGDAFCHYLLPTRAERRHAEALAREHDMALTLATPPLSDPELVHLRKILAWLQPGEEVEVNDWGVLRLLSREFPHLVPVLGRALLKALKDPRGEGGDRAPAVSAALAALLRHHGVRTVTADTLAEPGEFDLAVVLPYQFVSSGRICLIGATSLDTSRRFSLEAPCQRECRDFMLDLRTPDLHLVQKGNTVFAPWRAEQLPRLAAALAAGRVRRVVYASGVDRDRLLLGGRRDELREAAAEPHAQAPLAPVFPLQVL